MTTIDASHNTPQAEERKKEREKKLPLTDCVPKMYS